MKIKMLPQEERPVEKAMLKGTDALSNTELLAVLLGSGTRENQQSDWRRKLFPQTKRGISRLAESSIQELTQVNGVGSFKAARILAGIELGKRIATRPKEKRISIHQSCDAANLFLEEMRYEKKEKFKALLLNAKGEIMSTELISVGELTSAPVHPREAFCQAVKKSAAAVIFVHNHPSGDPTPSKDDLDTTKRLVECGRLLGIRVIDHIVIGEGCYTSIAALMDI